MDFKDYAQLRLSRSGITVDESSTEFVFAKFKSELASDEFYTDPNKTKQIKLTLEVPELDETKMFLCIGTNNCFWIIDILDFQQWMEKYKTRSIPVEERGKHIRFYELPSSLANMCFTPIPDNHMTEYECTQWLKFQRRK